MKQYISLPIEKLVSDVAVDEAHIRELEDSIMAAGQLSPVLVREDSLEIIDGFHRVAAMKGLGFSHMECVLVSCDDEFFWDSRIMSAVLHKNVTFARSVEWIEQAFNTSQIASKHSNVSAAVQATYKGTADASVSEWVESKSKKWGLKPVTMKDLLYTKQVLSPKLYAQAKRGGDVVTSSHYKEIAKALPDQPEVQEAVADKVTAEELSVRQTTSVLKALRSAADKEEGESILRQPVSRTEEQMVREAKVEKLLSQPREVTPLEKWQQAKHEDVLYKLDLLGIINSSKAMTPEKISALTREQKADVYHTCEEVISEMRRIMDMIKSTVEPEYLIEPEYQLKEG